MRVQQQDAYRLTFKPTGEAQEFTGLLDLSLRTCEFLDPDMVVAGEAVKRSPVYSVRLQFCHAMKGGDRVAESPLWRLDRLF